MKMNVGRIFAVFRNRADSIARAQGKMPAMLGGTRSDKYGYDKRGCARNVVKVDGKYYPVKRERMSKKMRLKERGHVAYANRQPVR